MFKKILLTGGTGSFGKAFTKYILENHKEVTRIVIYSRDEQKQYLMSQEFPSSKYPQLRFFIGDVRDFGRLKTAMKGCDTVIHAAAMKHVPIAEYNPMECVKTNILGAENVINASLESGIKNVVALSTDKAAAPINLYGATKLTSDKLFTAANNITGNNPIKFSVVRYGNVMGSNGSVIPFFLNKKKEGKLPITDERMTRFNITLEDGVKMVIWSLKNHFGGEIFVPKIPSYRITDLAEAIGPECEKPIVGIRPGEKIHEEMITTSDSFTTYDLGKYYAILPQNVKWDINQFIKTHQAKAVIEGFKYNSGTNPEFLTIQELKSLINQYCSPEEELK